MDVATRNDALRRIRSIEGHLAGIRRMIEDDKYCVDILEQTYAVRRALRRVEAKLIEAHYHTCVSDGFREGRDDQVIAELLRVYELAK